MKDHGAELMKAASNDGERGFAGFSGGSQWTLASNFGGGANVWRTDDMVVLGGEGGEFFGGREIGGSEEIRAVE